VLHRRELATPLNAANGTPRSRVERAMAYRIAAINEAAREEQREIETFAEALHRGRKSTLRRVVMLLVITFASAFAIVVSFITTCGPPHVTFGSTQTCSDDTCLCWFESQHRWAPVDCARQPHETCFESLGTCSAK
jgi:hypothetical protein